MFSEELHVCGISSAVNKNKNAIVTIVYAKGVLDPGYQQKAQVTVTEEVC